MRFDGPQEDDTLSAGRVLGQPADRVDGTAKLTGQVRYAADRAGQAQNLAEGVIVGAAIAKGRLVSIDLSAAQAMPGVLGVVTADSAGPLAKGQFNNARLLAGPEIEHYHQAVALVIADSPETARAAANLVKCVYDAAPPVADLAASLDRAVAPASVPGGGATDSDLGDFDTAFARGPIRLDETYSTPGQSPAMMEPHASIATWGEDGLDLWTSTQMVAWVRNDMARILGLEPARVRVSSPFTGGGFGAKTSVRADALLAALGARLVGRPVRVVLPRALLFNNTQHRAATIQRVRIAADPDGTILALGHEAWSGDTNGARMEAAALPVRLLYSAPHRISRNRLVTHDLPECGPMRAPGETTGLMALEIAMDEMAEQLSMDPVQFRLRNDSQLHPVTGRPFSARQLARCFEIGAERFGWSARSATPGQRREGDQLIGLGTAAGVRGNTLMPSKARVRLHEDGRLTVETDMTDIGTGSYTIIAQTAAEMMGLDLDQVTVRLGESDFPVSCGSAGQFGAGNSTAGVYAACKALQAAILQRVGINSKEARFENGQVLGTAISVPLARAAAGGELVVEDGMEYGQLSELHQCTFAAQFVEVGVDVVTAEVRVRRMLAVCDAGRILNPKTARSQVIGSMVMGVGAALMEELVPDTNRGFFLNHDFAGYEIPVCADIFQQDAIFLNEPDEMASPIRAKGVGELGLCGVPAAISNAIYNATGVRLRDYPMTPDKLLAAMPPLP